MKSHILLQIILFALILCSCAQKTKEEQIRAVRNSVVSISIKGADGKVVENSLGTGFFIDKNLLVTALHVYEDNLDALQKYGAGSAFVARKSVGENSFNVALVLLATDKDSDLAIFRFNPEDIEKQWMGFVISPLAISKADPDIAEEISTAGFHSDYTEPTSSVGIIGQITQKNEILSDLTVVPGMSGSPLFSLKKNEVVGVNVRITTVRGAQVRISVSTKSTVLLKFVEKVKNEKDTTK